MKKLLWIVASFFVMGVGSVAFSQTYEVYNKFGTEGIYELQDNGQGTGKNPVALEACTTLPLALST